jgi:hypothetical protein
MCHLGSHEHVPDVSASLQLANAECCGTQHRVPEYQVDTLSRLYLFTTTKVVQVATPFVLDWMLQATVYRLNIV